MKSVCNAATQMRHREILSPRESEGDTVLFSCPNLSWYYRIIYVNTWGNETQVNEVEGGVLYTAYFDVWPLMETGVGHTTTYDNVLCVFVIGL